MNDLPDKDFLAHFPNNMTKEMCDFVRDVVFKERRYIFTHREGRKQIGYCTHCGKEWETVFTLYHKDKETCPWCKSRCIVQASGKGRSKMVDEAYFVWYDKSAVNPNAIVAYGIWAIKDYREDYRQVETKFKVVAAYLFEPGNAQMYKRIFGFEYYWGRCNYDVAWVGPWDKRKSTHTLFASSIMSGKMAHLPSFYSRGSIEASVKGTPFRWSGWEKYDYECMTKFFGLFAKYPCLEYFTKLGFYDLVEDKLKGLNTNGSVNWRGKNLFKILRINKQELNEIKKQNVKVDYDFLSIFQRVKKTGEKFTTSELIAIAEKFSVYYYEQLLKIKYRGEVGASIRYLMKQSKKYPKQFPKPTDAMSMWKDYLDECVQLKMNLTKENIMYPPDLHKAHQATIRKIHIKKDRTLNKKIKKRLPDLLKYCFEFEGIFIRPAESSIELIDEGATLDHCVGNYSKRYAEGETDILLLRSVAEPSVPFYTVEIRDNRVIQVRGRKNCSPTKEVERFMKEFEPQVLSKKKSKTKIPA